ncbi:hypothetical protein FNH13_17765 [Ornithinimicrobium ciconiae]|uniref:Uncharacterized protein n=1 Tax=Ornithinimicrobium ciconiae TaxID=2594265 RepID=A0A516GEI4_9MICO|nr:hypothetical protein [Ornithinimicrobium ciconiae]QDO89947.1 hypothetical protein FNH13_17765 [Ornithinimicrobium ciconiae]
MPALDIDYSTGDGSPVMIGAIAVVAVLLLGLLTKRATENKARADRSQEADSIEFRLGLEARAGSYMDCIILGSVLFCISALAPSIPSWLTTFVYLVLITASFWIRFAVKRGGFRG